MKLDLKLARLLVNKLINFVYLRDLQHKTLNVREGLQLPSITKSVHLIPVHHNNCKELFISVGIAPYNSTVLNIGTQSVQELFFVIAFVELLTGMI